MLAINIADCYTEKVILAGLKLVEQFKKKHPNCATSLDRVCRLLETVPIKVPMDLKQVFGAGVDFVGKKTVIDVGGNKARMIMVISYRKGMGTIEAVLTHAEYDREKWKD